MGGFFWPGSPSLFLRDWKLWPGALGGAEWRTWMATLFFRNVWPVGDFLIWEAPVLLSWSCGIAGRTVLPSGGADRDIGWKCSHLVSHVHHPEPPTLDEFWPFRESALSWHARRWSWWAWRWPPQLPTPITQPDRWAWWTSHAAQPKWTPTPLDAATTTTDEPGPPPTWAPWPSSNG